MDNVKVFVLLAGMVVLFGVVGGMLGGQGGMLVALGIAAVMSFMMYFNSGKMALRAYKAQIVTREQAPELCELVDQLRQRAGLPMPTVAIAPIPSRTPSRPAAARRTPWSASPRA
jgi:heat shock protein HtpX